MNETMRSSDPIDDDTDDSDYALVDLYHQTLAGAQACELHRRDAIRRGDDELARVLGELHERMESISHRIRATLKARSATGPSSVAA